MWRARLLTGTLLFISLWDLVGTTRLRRCCWTRAPTPLLAIARTKLLSASLQSESLLTPTVSSSSIHSLVPFPFTPPPPPKHIQCIFFFFFAKFTPTHPFRDLLIIDTLCPFPVFFQIFSVFFVVRSHRRGRMRIGHR